MWNTILQTLTPSAKVLALFMMVLGPALPTMAAQDIATPLLDQITRLDLGVVERDGDTIALTQADGTTYVFANINRTKSGVASASVSVYDAEGQLLHTITFAKGVRSIDDNRIDFDAEVISAGETAATAISGSLSGLRGASGGAVAMIAENQGATEVATIDFGGLPNGDGNTTYSVVGTIVGATGAVISSPGALIVIGAVVLFVAVTCFGWGWWGC